MQDAPTISKANTKTRHVASTLRGQIVSGEWGPGSQLPTWSALEGQFNVGRTTLTRALGHLKRDGFVFADATRGTFVSERPPHLFRYAMAFRGVPNKTGWTRFWSALTQQAVTVDQQGDLRIVPFYDVSGTAQTPNHQRLVAEVADDRFAGIIFVGYPPELSTELMHHPWLAKVAICSDRKDEKVPHVYPDRSAFVHRSLRYLAERGRRRVAVISEGNPAFAEFDQALSEYGLSANPCYRVAANVADPDSAAQIVRLLLNQRDGERPDALIVTDDNLLDSVLVGLMSTGLRLPDDLMVIAHCNWPTESPSALPLVRLGFDAANTLDVALREAEAQRQGDQPTPFTPIAPIFDFERAKSPSRFLTVSI